MPASSHDANLRFLVIGCGSIGRRHIRNLRALGISQITAFDAAAERLDQAAQAYHVAVCDSVEAGIAQGPEAILICTPPHLHTALAKRALESGAHVFLEKPLAVTLDGVDELLSAARNADRLLCVAYNLRFHAGLRKLKELLDAGVIGRPLVIRAEVGQYLPDWRPSQDYRTGYNVSAMMGGGIILDASHELDYVRWLGGEATSVYCVAGKLSDLEMDVEDTAAITLRMDHDVIGEIHLDCVQRGYTRNCKVVGTEGTLVWDFKEGVRHLTADKTWHVYPIAPDPNEMYVEEMRHFITCLHGAAVPMVDGATGKRVLEIALAAKRSAATRAEVVI